jgi:sigma-B regulation protein RsbU (phosphoserine phosphatase)
MFIPCDHCLRKHATHFSATNEKGQPEHLRLCKDCHEKLKQSSALSPDFSMNLSDSELAIAEQMVSHLIPPSIPRIPGYDFLAYYRPSREVGADYYDFIELDADHLGLLVADVSGKGLPAAIVMTEFRALLKTESKETLSPARTFARVNRVLFEEINRGMFVTSFYAVLSLKSGTMTCVSGGHNPMVLWCKTSNTCHLVNPNGLALGIDKGDLFEKLLKEETFQLSKGDRFTLYTDGVIESTSEDQVELGQSRFHVLLQQVADRSSSDFLSLLVEEVDRHRGSARQHDDITILTGRVV